MALNFSTDSIQSLNIPSHWLQKKQLVFGLSCNLVSQTITHALYHMHIFTSSIWVLWPVLSILVMVTLFNGDNVLDVRLPSPGVYGAGHRFPLLHSEALFTELKKERKTNILQVLQIKRQVRLHISFHEPPPSLSGQRVSAIIHLPYSRSPPQSRKMGHTR